MLQPLPASARCRRATSRGPSVSGTHFIAGHGRLDIRSDQRGVTAMPSTSQTQTAQPPAPTDVARRWAWIGLLGSASIGFSLLFACATPFVAVVTLPALTMSRREAFIVTGGVWLANRAVGDRSAD